MKNFAVIVAAAVLCSIATAEIIIKPLDSKKGLPEAALVMVQGAQIDAHMYLPLVAKIQQIANFYLWVGLPEFPLNTPIPVGLIFNGQVDHVVNSLTSQGLKSTSPIFFYAHSLGAISMQDYVRSTQFPVGGQILAGANLLRKNRQGYTVPTLSLNGDLDGLMRVTRTAEAFYHQIQNAVDPTLLPVVVLPGVNHMQHASGQPPALVKSMDLRAEVTDDQAHQMMAEVISAFMTIRTGGQSDTLSQAVKDSAVLLKPVIDSLVMESSTHLKTPCNSDHPNPTCGMGDTYYPAWPPQLSPRTPDNNTDCTCGNKYVMERAMQIMTGLDTAQYPIHVRDAIHDVSDINPFHHPHMWNNCSGMSIPCTLNLTTVSQNVYDSLDDFDTGFTHTSAYETRVKFASRQTIYRGTINWNAKMADTDGESICAEMNKDSFQWALDNAGEAARQRFLLLGQQVTFGDDEFPPLKVGPLWIYSPLKLDNVQSNGVTVLKITSIAFKTDLDGPEARIPFAPGYHFCKLLSPARAMEWIYIDGLRLRMPIQSK